MKLVIENLMRQALEKAIRETKLNGPLPKSVLVEHPKQASQGDYASNVALMMARSEKKKPIEVARVLCQAMEASEEIFESIEIAGPGFINFRIKTAYWQKVLKQIEEGGEAYALPQWGRGQKVLIEFISANPTGPLHIGNARGGPLGDALATLLAQVGHKVDREFYVNDIGGQVERLAHSIEYWAAKEEGKNPPKPEDGYEGEYVQELAKKFLKAKKRDPAGDFGLQEMLSEIREDCAAMGIHFDQWISEAKIQKDGKTQAAIVALQKAGETKVKEGATWFSRAGEEGAFFSGAGETQEDDRESVLIRSNGTPTYFADDIAYHVDKFQRGYDRLINIWGSNHHGHVPRMKAALKALEHDDTKIEIILYQYVRVVRGEQAVKMSKRAGDYVTAREVLDEVGKDAFRFFMLMRSPEAHLDFDLELAKSQSQDNPVYYVQYAHARICSVFRKAEEQGLKVPSSQEFGGSPLVLPEELSLIKKLFEYPEVLETAATRYAPHHITFYLLDLSRLFQSYYSQAKTDSRYRVLPSSADGAALDTARAKLYLLKIIRKILSDGLTLLGISAPETMARDEEAA